MATALARQLQAIRSETTATLDKRKHEKAASLLFDPKEAAERDYDTILALGVNGLQGLVQIDSRFKPFAKTLFSETSRDIDRAIQVCRIRIPLLSSRRSQRMTIWTGLSMSFWIYLGPMP